MSITAQIGLLRGAVAAAGAAMPKPLATALADFDRAVASAQAYEPPSAAQAAELMLDCVLAGTDPFEDDGVRSYVVAAALTSERGGLLGLQAAAERRATVAIEQHADALYAILCQAIDTAGQDLTAAYEILGDHSLDDAPSILRQGDDASRAWNSARAALARLRHLERGWVTLAEVTRTATTTEPTLRLAALALDQYEQVGRQADGWDIVRAGAAISCATPAELRQRIDHIQQQREHRQAGHDGAFAEQYQRQHGMGRAVVA